MTSILPAIVTPTEGKVLAAIAAENSAKADPIDNTSLVEAFKADGGKLYHFRPFNTDRQGVTFAYKVKGNRITFSTAVQHRNDTFTKKLGTKTAIDHFNEGAVVTLPLRRNGVYTPVNLLHSIGRIAAS